MTRAEGRRAGELLLAFLAHDDDRYDDLMEHTRAEYALPTMIDRATSRWCSTASSNAITPS
jgi:hypothetical protein